MTGTGALYYGFICFNRAKPQNGSIYVARYDGHGSSYALTRRVDRGTPSVAGLFQDKINITADQESGNVYVAWARFSGNAGNDVIMFARSTDRGRTYSKPQRISDGGTSEQFADLAVGPDGAVYLTYRTYSTKKASAAIAIVKSTDRDQSFTTPRTVAEIDPFDSDDDGPDTCGDGPFRCASGLNYARFSSLSAVAADAGGVHIVWSARDGDGQAKIFASNSPDGLSWPAAPATLDTAFSGHQFFPRHRQRRRNALGGLPGLARGPGLLARPASRQHGRRDYVGGHSRHRPRTLDRWRRLDRIGGQLGTEQPEFREPRDRPLAVLR